MPFLRSAAKLAARENAEPYKPHPTPRKVKPSNNIPKTTEGVISGAIDDKDASIGRAAIKRRPATTKQRREMCTADQTVDLEEFYMIYGGNPTKEQKQQLATRIGKTYHSTDIWIRNRRAKEQRVEAKPQTRVHVTADAVAASTSAIDTPILEESNTGHPEEPALALSRPLQHRARATRPGRRATKQAKVQAASKRPNRAKKQIRNEPSSPATDIAATNEYSTSNDHYQSGDSNGSASQPPENTPHAVPHIWLPMAPEHAQLLQRYSIDEQVAAQRMIETKSMTENPCILPGRILSDAYAPWPFRLSSASEVSMSGAESQRPEIGRWRNEGIENIYWVDTHRVPSSWMVRSS